MAVKQVIRSEKELVKFLNNHGIARRLKFLARTLMLTPKKFRFVFQYKSGRGSYTDGTDVYIEVPEFMVGHSKEEIFYSLKAMTAHEVEHINSSSFEALKEFAIKFGEYFNTKHGIHQGLAMNAGKYLDNSIEDGRIERLTTDRNKGLKKPIIYFRSLWWQNQDLNEKGREDNTLFDTLFAICTIATMGQLPLGYLDRYDDEYPELHTMLKNAKKYIYRCVDSDVVKDYYERLWELVYVLEDWLVEEFKKIPEPEEAENELGEMLKEFGEKSSKAHSTPKGGAMPSSPSEPKDEEEGEEGSSPSEEKSGEEENEEGKDSGENSENSSDSDDKSLRDMFENFRNATDEGSFDGDMRDVVKEAMRSAEEEIQLDEGKTIIQAEIDDRRIKEEEKKTSGTESDIESDSLHDIEESYGKKAWPSRLKVHRHKYTLMTADGEIMQSAKKIKKDFEEIFINKVSKEVRNKKKGMLNTNDLYKLSQGDKKIFMKKGSPDSTDFAFYILVDGSGSMSGNKFVEAYRATATLEESLSGLAPLKIVQFDCDSDSRGSIVNHYIVKDFNDNKKGNYSTTFLHHKDADNCNMDGFSIRVATEELLKRPEQRKVLIILSDGLPSGACSYYGRDAQADVKDAIRYARKKHLDVFNIMFGRERERKEMIPDFKFMYEKGIVSCDPKDIANTLCKLVKKEIKK